MKTTDQPIDINPTHLETIQRILTAHVPDCEVRAFGSRAKWNAEDYSDLDLAVVSGQPLRWRALGDLRDAFEESDLPFRVDVLDWHDISDRFKNIIQEDYAILSKPINRVSDWKQTKLGDVADVSWGDTSTTKSKYTKSGFVAYSAKGPDGYLPYADYSITGIVISAIGADCGKTWLAKGQWSCIKNTIRFWSTDPAVDTEFLYWITRDPDFWPKRGSAQPFISQGDARNLMISYPPLEQQRSISHILGTLDDKIELNRRMNETLEAMAQALFKSWFIDFDPVRAKMEGRWRPGESLPGLPAHLYDLFPDHLVPSELGEIPEGWDVKPLTDCFNLTMGQSPPGDTYNDERIGLPFFQGSTDFSLRYPKATRYCSEPQRTAQLSDTLVSVRAPVGAVNMAWEECCIGRGLASLRHKSNAYSFTYYSILNLKSQLQQFEHTGTVFGAITKQQLRNMRIIEPTLKVIQAFGSYATDLDNFIYRTTAESAVLSSYRNTMILSLMTGNIR